MKFKAIRLNRHFEKQTKGNIKNFNLNYNLESIFIEMGKKSTVKKKRYLRHEGTYNGGKEKYYMRI